MHCKRMRRNNLRNEYLGSDEGQSSRPVVAGREDAPSLSISNNSIIGNGRRVQNTLQGGHKRCAEVVSRELLKLSRVYGINRLGFFTLTFAGRAPSLREAMRRFNSLLTNVLRERYVKGVRILERGGERGRLHFHCVVVLEKDIRTGFDFHAIAQGRYDSANEYLRSEWAFWRKTASSYGFGRTELLPVKSTAEGIARYVGAYIAKHVRSRIDEDKGARLVGFWGYRAGDRAATCMFAFNTPKAQLWRHKVAVWAGGLGARRMEDVRACYGPKWCYKHYDDIFLVDIDGFDGLCLPQSVIDSNEQQVRAIIERRCASREEREKLQHAKWDKTRERVKQSQRVLRMAHFAQVVKEFVAWRSTVLGVTSEHEKSFNLDNSQKEREPCLP